MEKFRNAPQQERTALGGYVAQIR
jgi:hypothetical protein